MPRRPRLPSRLARSYLLFVTLGWLLAEYVGERTVPTLLLAYAPAVLWLAPAPFVWLWALLRRHKLGVTLVATLLALWGTGVFHWRPQAAGTLKVLTYNVARGSKATPAQLAAHLKAQDADIILLQEANFWETAFREQFEASLPSYTSAHAAEVTTMTRLPVLESETYDLPRNRREVLVTRVMWEGRPLTIVNAHLGTVMLSPLLKGDFARVRQTRDARREQVEVLKRIALSTEGPTLLGGDLNTPPRGLIYRRLQSFFGSDAFDRAGRGPGWTFPSLKLRIDHQFTRDLKPTRARVLQNTGSDHLPLLVEYR